ncbi:MAG: hypothetical protein N3A57_03285 [Negativicutes bacterium]|nr:hypothetical protein [Negativicutes bacterium]
MLKLTSLLALGFADMLLGRSTGQLASAMFGRKFVPLLGVGGLLAGVT